MKMPNLASLYHWGCWYLPIMVSQSARYGPSLATRSVSARILARVASYLATDCCHSRSISAADFVSRVGARGSDWAEAVAVRTSATAQNAREPRRSGFAIGPKIKWRAGQI